MPFDNDQPWVFDRQGIESFSSSQTGVYAIYNAQEWIYIGREIIDAGVSGAAPQGVTLDKCNVRKTCREW